MSWITRKELDHKPEVGEYVTTTRELETCSGKFTVGSRVKIVGVGERGYDIEDDEGHRVVECGWTI